ncbi:MAG: ADP-ribosylglycohydrolase family protein [Clostridia bacterium]|nr:ADP-ribosylglycohydrolase family protein [Clostridia bacterium]
MYGALIGDIAGSRFEFDNHKSKEFALFTEACSFTDDSVMTLAVALALLDFETVEDYPEFKRHLADEMKSLGRLYPRAGYGGRFRLWLTGELNGPYRSYGNGSAMRVSPVAWYAHSLEEAESLAKASAEVSHNHPEGIKGAVATAGCIYLARTGASRDAIRTYARGFYPLDFTLDEIRQTYRFNETCQETVPQAIVAFWESTDFEDAIRCAVSLGGDSDTLAAITGSIAEAFYGIPAPILEEAMGYLDQFLLLVAQRFGSRYVNP